jgi:rRNA maturation endonuclease Nob1
MNKKIEISFEKEYNSILDNKEFIQKSNLVDILKDNFKKVLNELKDKEEKVLKEYGINKNNLLQIKEYNEEQINRIKKHLNKYS